MCKFNEPQAEFTDVFESTDENEFDSETESHHETEAHEDDKDDDTSTPDVDSTLVAHEESIHLGETSSSNNDVPPSRVQNLVETSKIHGNPNTGVKTRAQIRNEVANHLYISKIEPKNVKEALLDKNWIIAMQE